MITMEIPNLFGLATLTWTFIPAGRQFSCTWGYQDTLSNESANAAAVAIRLAAIQTGGPCAAASMSTNWRFDGVTTLQRISTGLLIAGSAGPALTGTTTASADQPAVLMTTVVSKKTLYAGRHFRGRMYPPFTNQLETEIDYNGSIAGTTVANLQTKWNLFYGTSSFVTDYRPYLLHAAVPVGPSIPPTLVQSLFVRPVVGIQRRRRARGA